MIRQKILMWLTSFLPARAIDLESKFYIERYFVFRIGKLTVMLHRYLGSDGDRHVHDHPWLWCMGIPLINGYREERVIGFCPQQGWVSEFVDVRWWRWNFISARRFHRIHEVLPGTWTLFITYNRFKSWSFANRPKIPTASVVLTQPYDVNSFAGWQNTAPKGEEFRIARGTN